MLKLSSTLLFFFGVYLQMGVSENSGTPKSSILIGFSIGGTPIFGNTQMISCSWVATIEEAFEQTTRI